MSSNLPPTSAATQIDVLGNGTNRSLSELFLRDSVSIMEYAGELPIGDGVALSGMSMTQGSTVLTAPSASFTAADVGKAICVSGAGTPGTPSKMIVTFSGVPADGDWVGHLGSATPIFKYVFKTTPVTTLDVQIVAGNLAATLANFMTVVFAQKLYYTATLSGSVVTFASTKKSYDSNLISSYASSAFISIISPVGNSTFWSLGADAFTLVTTILEVTNSTTVKLAVAAQSAVSGAAGWYGTPVDTIHKTALTDAVNRGLILTYPKGNFVHTGTLDAFYPPDRTSGTLLNKWPGLIGAGIDITKFVCLTDNIPALHWTGQYARIWDFTLLAGVYQPDRSQLTTPGASNNSSGLCNINFTNGLTAFVYLDQIRVQGFSRNMWCVNAGPFSCTFGIIRLTDHADTNRFDQSPGTGNVIENIFVTCPGRDRVNTGLSIIGEVQGTALQVNCESMHVLSSLLDLTIAYGQRINSVNFESVRAFDPSVFQGFVYSTGWSPWIGTLAVNTSWIGGYRVDSIVANGDGTATATLNPTSTTYDFTAGKYINIGIGDQPFDYGGHGLRTYDTAFIRGFTESWAGGPNGTGFAVLSYDRTTITYASPSLSGVSAGTQANVALASGRICGTVWRGSSPTATFSFAAGLGQSERLTIDTLDMRGLFKVSADTGNMAGMGRWSKASISPFEFVVNKLSYHGRNTGIFISPINVLAVESDAAGVGTFWLARRPHVNGGIQLKLSGTFPVGFTGTGNVITVADGAVIPKAFSDDLFGVRVTGCPPGVPLTFVRNCSCIPMNPNAIPVSFNRSATGLVTLTFDQPHGIPQWCNIGVVSSINGSINNGMNQVTSLGAGGNSLSYQTTTMGAAITETADTSFAVAVYEYWPSDNQGVFFPPTAYIPALVSNPGAAQGNSSNYQSVFRIDDQFRFKLALDMADAVVDQGTVNNGTLGASGSIFTSNGTLNGGSFEVGTTVEWTGLAPNKGTILGPLLVAGAGGSGAAGTKYLLDISQTTAVLTMRGRKAYYPGSSVNFYSTVLGARVGDRVQWTLGAPLPDGLTLQVFVSDIDTICARVSNQTAANISPYRVIATYPNVTLTNGSPIIQGVLARGTSGLVGGSVGALGYSNVGNVVFADVSGVALNTTILTTPSASFAADASTADMSANFTGTTTSAATLTLCAPACILLTCELVRL